MTMTDPVADLATAIRNGLMIEREEVKVPHSRLKIGILDVLKREGFIGSYTVEPGHVQGLIRITLKYGRDGEQVIRTIRRVSKPGCRKFWGLKDLKPVLQGMGIIILSTDRGILSDREARQKKLGGEPLLEVW